MTDALPLRVFLSRYGFTALVVFSGSTVIVKDGAGKGTLYSNISRQALRWNPQGEREAAQETPGDETSRQK